VLELPSTVTLCTDSLESLTVCNRHARARIFLQGAHVLSFRPVGEGEVLWSSVRSLFEQGKPIRGGIPICFPWFGAGSSPTHPAHGFARTTPFELVRVEDSADGATHLRFRLIDSEATRSLWPHPFAASVDITVGATLVMAFTVANTGDAPFSFEEALHTYFDVSDVRHVSVVGLEDAPFLDKVAGGVSLSSVPGPIRFEAETDRVYNATTAPTRIDDPGLVRSIVIEKEASHTTVVWNPWVAKAARMADFGDDEWPGMVCVESANAGTDRVTLQPGETHRLELRVGVRR
jgi:glucose-6-phosphate 1-epimerase